MNNGKLERPIAILFDWDNTLVDTWPIIHKAINETFKTFGRKQWTVEETKKYVHKSMRDSFPVLFGDEWQKASEVYLKNFLECHLVQLKSLPHSEELLGILSNTEIYMAVVSNKTGKHLRTEASHIGWEKYFSKIVGATDAKADKPSPEPILLALEGTKIKPSESVWLIGDSITDLECALNSGCKPIFYGEHEMPEEYKIHNIPHFRNHRELIELVKKF